MFSKKCSDGSLAAGEGIYEISRDQALEICEQQKLDPVVLCRYFEIK